MRRRCVTCNKTDRVSPAMMYCEDYRCVACDRNHRQAATIRDIYCPKCEKIHAGLSVEEVNTQRWGEDICCPSCKHMFPKRENDKRVLELGKKLGYIHEDYEPGD